jgi:endoribonuclease Dicer
LNFNNTINTQLNYSVWTQDGMFQAEVFLPDVDICPVKSAVGSPATSKTKAKQAAAMKACRELIKGQLLDKNLQPIFEKRVHGKPNTRRTVKG